MGGHKSGSVKGRKGSQTQQLCPHGAQSSLQKQDTCVNIQDRDHRTKPRLPSGACQGNEFSFPQLEWDSGNTFTLLVYKDGIMLGQGCVENCSQTTIQASFSTAHTQAQPRLDSRLEEATVCQFCFMRTEKASPQLSEPGKQAGVHQESGAKAGTLGLFCFHSPTPVPCIPLLFLLRDLRLSKL